MTTLSRNRRRDRRPRPDDGSHGGRALLPALALVALGGLALSGCAPEPDPEENLAMIDSVLVELGGTPASVLNRTQRWRMISSLGVGLPPPRFERANLPDPDSYAAGLLEAHCQACHWLPAPQMHSAQEWPLLLRRMILRGETLGEHLGGPLVAELVGSERMIEGMGMPYLPSAEAADSLLAYLQKHALPVAGPGELGDGADTRFFVEKCGICHETPSPAAHTAEEWQAVLVRMNEANMPVMGVEPLTDEELERVRAFLEARAAN